jgi:hypothetical protein
MQAFIVRIDLVSQCFAPRASAAAIRAPQMGRGRLAPLALGSHQASGVYPHPDRFMLVQPRNSASVGFSAISLISARMLLGVGFW